MRIGEKSKVFCDCDLWSVDSLHTVPLPEGSPPRLRPRRGWMFRGAGASECFRLSEKSFLLRKETVTAGPKRGHPAETCLRYPLKVVSDRERPVAHNQGRRNSHERPASIWLISVAANGLGESLAGVECVTHGLAGEDQQAEHRGDDHEAGQAEPGGGQIVLPLGEQLAEGR